MIDEYSIYFRHLSSQDVLIVYFNNGKNGNNYKKVGNFGVSLNGDTPIAYNFFMINKILKIHAKNMIYLPSNSLIDVINSLIPKDYPKLNYKFSSGYIIAKIYSMVLNPQTKKFVYYLDNSKNKYIETNDFCLNVGDIVVVAQKGVILPNGKKCLSDHICNGKDLQISDDIGIYKLDDNSLIGHDFFKMEENTNA